MATSLKTPSPAAATTVAAGLPHLSPLLTATIQGTLLAVLSNILAQTISAYRSGAPLTLDSTPILTFGLYTLLSTPPNFLWQDLLEVWFPSYPPAPAPTSTHSTSHSHASTPLRPLSKTNTLKKLLTDQAIAAPLNTLAFLAFMKGGSTLAATTSTITTATMPTAAATTTEILRAVAADFPKLHLASLKLWPLVGAVSFTCVPVEKRIVFGSLVALGWNVYLGLIMG